MERAVWRDGGNVKKEADMRTDELKRIGETDIPVTVIHSPQEYEKIKARILSGLNPKVEFAQSGTIHCKRCGKIKSLDMPERGMFVNCPCECMSELEAERKRREERGLLMEKYRRMSLNELGETYRKSGFEKLRMSGATEEFIAAAERCEKFCHNFSEVRKSGRGIWLYGNEKSGKTLLAACIVNELEREAVPCVFTTLDRILTGLKATYKNASAESEQELMQRLSQVDCLIIDDMEPIRASRGAGESWSAGRLAEIVKRRYDGKRPTVITSRYSLREIGTKGSLPMTVTDRLVERQVVMQVARRSGSAAETESVEF